MTGGAKPNDVEGLCIVFVVRLNEVSGLAIAAWAFLEPSRFESPFDGVMSPSLFSVVPPVGAASLGPVFLVDAAFPYRSVLAKPWMDAEILLAAVV